MSSTQTRFKRGTVRDDGKIFWGYYTNHKTNKATRVRWISKEDVPAAYCSQICAAAKQRARLADLPFDITPDYLLSIFPENMRCPIFGTEMQFFGDRSVRPSLDKIIPSEGYTTDNVAWISLEANRIKDNASLEVMQNLIRYMER